MKRYNISDYEKKCSLCGSELINMGDMWIHPDTDCLVDDGVVTAKKQAIFDVWMEEYGIPKRSSSENIKSLLKDLDVQIKASIKLGKECDKLESENTGLKELLQVYEERKWYKWLWESTKEMLMKTKSTKN
jgi:hypothetical protein